MKLVIQTPGNTTEVNGPLKTLMDFVRKDLAARGLPASEVQRHIYGLSFEMHRVRATTVADSHSNFIAGYRITR